MSAIQFETIATEYTNLRISVIKVINAKIQKVAVDLKIYMAKFQHSNQKPERPKEHDSSWFVHQKHVFETIETSSKSTTKLLFLRANLTDLNSSKVLYLVSSSHFKDLSIQQLKQEIR